MALFLGTTQPLSCDWDHHATVTSHARPHVFGEKNDIQLGLKDPKQVHSFGLVLILFCLVRIEAFALDCPSTNSLCIRGGPTITVEGQRRME
jgi:hypothetical protein